MLENTPNQPTKFRTKNWVEINDDSRGTYNTKTQIKFKTSMLRTSLCHYNDANILVGKTIAITRVGDNDVVRRLNKRNKGVIFKNCAPFTDCISETNNTQIDNAKYIDVIMPMYNLIEFSDNYSKKRGRLWQYRDDPNDNITEYESFKYKVKITGETPDDGNAKNVEIAVSLRLPLSNFGELLKHYKSIVKLISF